MSTPESIELKEPGQTIVLGKDPFMPVVLAKGLFLSLLRPSVDSLNRICFTKYSSSLNNIKLDPKKIAVFRKICCFDRDIKTVPMLYLQSLFIGQFGKYITSPFFPLLPLGLIHIEQSISQTRSINPDEILNTRFRLDKTDIDPKGLKIKFLLEIKSGPELVWQGVTTILCKSKKYKKKMRNKDVKPLAPFTTIDVPGNIGRQYAKVSGDYNPHHLASFFAKLFGFKKAIAHGMWSLARSVAGMEKHFPGKEVFSVSASFKQPIFIPGKALLAVKQDKNDITFELRNNITKRPHITGIARIQ